MGQLIYIDKESGRQFKIVDSAKTPARLYVTKKQSAAIMGLSESSLNVFMAKRTLAYIKLDKKVMFDVRDLMHFMQSRRIPAKK